MSGALDQQAAESQRAAQLTPLLPNDVLSRLERLRLSASKRFVAKAHGEHVSGRGGTSVEFSDYRDYAAGDDMRFVDWNIFARLNRPYLKLFQREEEMNVVVLVDASSSMLFEGKLDRAKELAAGLGVVGLLGAERVSLGVFNAKNSAVSKLGPCTGRANMLKLFRFLEGVEGGGDAPVEHGIERFLRQHTGRGVAVLLSDFLTYGDLKRAMNLLFGSGLEVYAVQILGPEERDPTLAGDVRLVDTETGDTLDVSSASDLLDIYQEYRAGFQSRLESLARARGGLFASVGSDDSLRWILFDLFRRKGWLS